MFVTGYVILLNKTQLSDVNIQTLKGKSHRFYFFVHNNAKLLSLYVGVASNPDLENICFVCTF